MRAASLWQPIGAGMLAAVVGFTSSVAVVINGLVHVGASEAQVASGLMLLSVAMGLAGAGLSLATRMPISVAWSTPGMAMLAGLTALPGGFPAALAAFLVTGLLIMLTGLWAALGDLVARLPKPIAAAMLAGILMKLCLMPVVAVQELPVAGLAVVVTWAVVICLARLWAAPAALVVALAAMVILTPFQPPDALLPLPAFVMPEFRWEAIISIALPLYVVTMASQNIPGLAVLATNGFRAPTRPVFLVTGAASSIVAPFGGPTINLAAITAALAAGPDAHPDRSKRWIAAVTAGLAYVAFGALAGIATHLVSTASPVLIEAVAGLALLPTLGASLKTAVDDEALRLPALTTFVVAASGFAAFGIGSAFWGLVAGVAFHALIRATTR